MAYILKGSVKMYYYLNDKIADRMTENWPLMRTPWPGLFILSLYLMVVFLWLPNHMSQRPPYDLRRLIASYNVIQIICCGYVVYHSLILGWLNHYSLFCQPLDEGPNAVEYAWKVCYAYFIIKLIDLVDTIFFVLRKKQNQVSFLHVYHHFGMVTVAWGIVKWVPGCALVSCVLFTGGHITMVILINSIVHIIMYAYYLLTTWDESYKRSLWWKKYVTQIQIVQFTILMIHFIVLMLAKECNYPREPAYILIPQNLFMVILFCDFYYRSYIKVKNN